MERLNLALPYSPTEFAIHSLRYLPLRGIVAGKRVLDIACGEGLGTSLISRWGAAHVVGVDVAGTAISVAKARLAEKEKANVEFIRDDAISYLERTTEDFDIIISAETVEHLENPRRFLELCRSRLTADGSFVVTCPNDHYYYGGGQTMNRYHLASYRFEDFKALAEDVLGAGEWALGAPLNGFGLFPLSITELDAGDYRDALMRRRGLGGETVPVPDVMQNGLTPGNSLFYLGAWGSLSLRRAFGVAIPRGSNHRLGDLRSVSEDIAQGAVRRMALVHDGEITADEVTALRDLLRGKYTVEAFAWTGDTRALGMALLNGPIFDNIHFETPAAFEAVAEWMTVSAPTSEFLDRYGARWSAATLTVRPDIQYPSDHNLAFADGAFGRAAAIRKARTATGERAVLWCAEASGAGNPDAAAPVTAHRIAVVMPAHAERESVHALIAAAQTKAGLTGLTIISINAGAPPQKIMSSLAEADALLCLDGTGTARRAAEQAIRHGLAVIVPSTHPLASILGDAQKPLVMVQPDVIALDQALQIIYLDPRVRSRIRAENLALAEHMTTNARGVFWTRALAQAQLSCNRYGAPLRAAVLKAAAQVTRSVPPINLLAIEAERDALRAECERLRRRDHDNTQ
ncbi:class I SAM-dependent methyltransferase [Paracoccus onubensis]|uniref:class I SAM-dependent methyltransferase n=1 Tax=Paracoccus onubensis TaxID=1675788 RepID=UPI001C724B26|nr:methyltransferase domain-containing protein [Paracoccus onubensis]